MELERSSSCTVASSASWAALTWEHKKRKESLQHVRLSIGKSAILRVIESGGICLLATVESISITELKNSLKYCSLSSFQSFPGEFPKRLSVDYHI